MHGPINLRFEILISVIERRPAVYYCSLKEYSDKGLKERLLGEVCEGNDGECWALWGNQKYGGSATVCSVFCRNDFLTTDVLL